MRGRRVGDGAGAGFGLEEAGVELGFGHVEAQDGFGRTHGGGGWVVSRNHAVGPPPSRRLRPSKQGGGAHFPRRNRFTEW